MREILFRGKDIHEKWHIGLLAHIGNAWYISNRAGVATAIEVIPSTIGQYTGLTDNNGTKIFEGDILKPDYDNSSYYRVAWDSGKLHLNIEEYCFNDSEGKALWSWCENIAQYQINGCVDNCEIIGNIHDNPELLEVGK